MSQTEKDWLRNWEKERAPGKTKFVLRGYVLIGLLPGAVLGLILNFVQPRVGDTNIGTAAWAIGIFIFVSALGLLRSWWWWRAAETHYNELLRKQ